MEELHVGNQFGNLFDGLNTAIYAHIDLNVPCSDDSQAVRLTLKRRLRQVDFTFDGNKIRGLEQNPETKSRWAQMAHSGKKVIQFLSEGRYAANVVDGKLTLYKERTEAG